MTDVNLETTFGFLGKDLVEEIRDVSMFREFPRNTELIREGQYVKVVPVVLSGLVKVMIRHEDRELLLYYIQPAESCIMSFSACINNGLSKVFAVTEEETSALLIPSDRLSRWVTEYPRINQLFFRLYDMRYAEMIDSISRMLFDRLDKRIYDYLAEKTTLTGRNPLKISHKELANDLGTAREVVSRLVKKMERDGKLKQHADSIEILNPW